MRNRPARIAKIAAIGVLAIAVFGFVLMALWNWLVPALFGGPEITFWQGLGLLVLSRILLGGWHGGSGRRRHWRRRMIERWERMTPEERERFRHGWGCGPSGMQGSQPNPAAE